MSVHACAQQGRDDLAQPDIEAAHGSYDDRLVTETRRRSWEPALVVLLLAVVVLAPLPLGSNRPLPESVLFTAIGMLVSLWGVAVAIGRAEYAVPLRSIWWFALPFLTVAAWAQVQAAPWTPDSWHHPLWADARTLLGEPVAGAISVDPHRTHTNLLWLLGYGGIFWLALQLARPSERADRILATLALAGIAYAAYGLVVHLSGSDTILWYDKWSGRGMVTSTFVNRNHYATYAGLTFLCALALLVSTVLRGVHPEAPWRRQLVAIADRANLPTLLGAFGTLVIGAALLLSQSRGGVLATLVAVLVFLALLAGQSWRGRLVYPLLVVVVLAGLAALIELYGANVAHRMAVMEIDHDQRVLLFRATIAAIGDRPWLGFGYGTFEEAFLPYNDELIGNILIDKAHNTYLQNAFELGIPAAALLVLSVGLVVLRCVIGLWRRRRQQATLAVAIAASVLVAVHALVDFSLEIPAIAATYALILGVGCAQSWSSRVTGAVGPEPARSGNGRA